MFEPPSTAATEASIESLAARLAETAVERDRAGGHPAREREWIRDSGLLGLVVPTEHGGLGRSFASMLQATRRLAEVDSALAHLFAFHHLQLASILLWGTPAQQSKLLRATLAEGWFWGNALNPIDRRTLAAEAGDGWTAHGLKSYCSGSVGSDMLMMSAWHEATQSLLVAALPTRRDGIAVQPDWDAFGQRQTDSGNVAFEQVRIDAAEVLVRPGQPLGLRFSMRSQLAQLVLVNLYAGLAVGAFDAATRYTRERSKPWAASGVPRAVDDPYVQHRYGDLWLLVKPAVLLADAAGRAYDEAYARGDALTAQQRGEVSVAIAEAKVLAHRASVEVGSQMFELTGASATSARHGLDRYWRNARVHTLHDPVDYKLRDIGRFRLDGRLPEPSSYS